MARERGVRGGGEGMWKRKGGLEEGVLLGPYVCGVCSLWYVCVCVCVGECQLDRSEAQAECPVSSQVQSLADW